MKKSIGLSIFLVVLLAFQIQGVDQKNIGFNGEMVNGRLEHTFINPNDNAIKSVLTQRWLSGNWEDVRRIVNTYNDAGLLTLINYDSLHQGSWRTIIESEMEYNPSNKLLRSVVTIKDIDGNIENRGLSEYSYSGENVTEIILSNWNESLQSWNLSGKQVYEYTNDQLSKSRFYHWNEASNDYDLFMETTYQYDNEGREIESISQIWDESNEQFINQERTTIEYYEGMKISRKESKSWDSINEQWSDDNYTLHEYQYDGNGNKIEYVFTSALGFGGFSILMKSKSNYEYDSNNYLILENNYRFDEITQTWIEIGKVEYTNDASGVLQYEIYFVYDGTNFINYEKNIYNYEDVVDVDNTSKIPTQFVLNQNYPNPFNPSTVISYSIPEAGDVTLRIFDILGNTVTTLVDTRLQAGEYNTTFNASNLGNISSGVYIISLQAGEFSSTKKCLLLK